MRNITINGCEPQSNDFMMWQEGGAENLTENLGRPNPHLGPYARADRIVFSSFIHLGKMEDTWKLFQALHTHTYPPNQPYTLAHIHACLHTFTHTRDRHSHSSPAPDLLN